MSTEVIAPTKSQTGSQLGRDRRGTLGDKTAGDRPIGTDRRLLQSGRSARAYLMVSVGLGTVSLCLLIVAQSWLLATVIAGAFLGGEELRRLRTPTTLLLAVVALRALLAWYTEVAADRSSARVKSQLRTALVERLAVVGPRGLVARPSGDMATLATRGVDALDGYYARYLPQLVLAVLVPMTVLVVVWSRDWVSALIILVTVPLIPVFMVLIGMATREHNDRQLRTLQALSGHFLDVVAGLTTLKVFGRSKAQMDTVRRVTDRYRRTTMATLRLAFLSLVLELFDSVAVALVAVSVGLRLLYGDLDLATSLFVLILAPEAYLPLRLVGANYHASAEGLSAAEQVFEVLDEPVAAQGRVTAVPDPATNTLVVEGLGVTYPGRDQPALDRVSLHIAPGQVLGVTGPNGCGKSTLLAVLLGCVNTHTRNREVGGTDLTTIDPDEWRARVAWVPQRPHLFSGSLEENLRLGSPAASVGTCCWISRW